MTFSLSAPLFVEVAVPFPIDHPFTYRVPAGEEGRAMVGVRVLVPFGRRKITGIVTAITDASALGDGRRRSSSLSWTPPVRFRPPPGVPRRIGTGVPCPDGGDAARGPSARIAAQEAPSEPRTETFYRAVPGSRKPG